MLKGLKQIVVNLVLDILSIPGLFMKKEGNAKYHLKVVCPLCPKYRKKYREVNKKGRCWWKDNWEKKKYNIPRNFGILNWVKSYLSIKTDLKRFK